MMRFLPFILLALFVAGFPASSAYAACTSPTAADGAKEWFSGDNTYKYCIGSTWIAVTEAGNLTACTTAAEWDYDSGQTAFKQCRASVWRKVGCIASGGGGGSLANGEGGDGTDCKYISWTQQETNRTWRRIAMSDNGQVLAAVPWNQQIYVSTNAGANWTARESAREWADITMSGDGSVMLAANGWGNGLYVSTNSGTNWTARQTTVNWFNVAMSDNGVIMYAYGGGGLSKSTDTGTNWTVINAALGGEMDTSSDGSVVIVGGTDEPINFSLNGGSTWSTYGPSTTWGGVAVSDDGTKMYAVDRYENLVYASTDSGATWKIYKLTGGGLNRSMKTSDDGRTVVAGMSNSCGINISVDSGKTWSLHRCHDINGNFHGVDVSADGSIIVGVNSGGQIQRSSCAAAADCTTAGGKDLAGACWFLGAAAQSCTTVCSGLSGDYNVDTRDFAGSFGKDSNCNDVLNAFGVAGTSTAQGGTAAAGCHYSSATRYRNTTATTPAASAAGVQRACACTGFVVKSRNAPGGCSAVGDTCTNGMKYAGDGNLYVAPANQTPTRAWSTENVDTTADDSSSGIFNFYEILYGYTIASYPAFKACDDIGVSSYLGESYWYLPAQNELTHLYNNKTALGMTTGTFWSSTEASGTNANYRNFSSGATSNAAKSTAYNTRCALRSASPTPYSGVSGFNGDTSLKTVFLKSGTSWTVPADWNSANNTIRVIGGGGGACDGGLTGSTCYSGSGGGGGAYASVSNVTLTPGTSVAYRVGTAGIYDGGNALATAGGDTYFCNSTSNCASVTGTAVIAGAKGGGAASGGASCSSAVGGGTGGVAASSFGTVKYSGGTGGTGSAAQWYRPGAGGGGAAGPSGNGGAGGAAANTNTRGGSGGGGANAGVAGGTASSITGATGGNGNAGAGGGTGGSGTTSGGNGTNGGGGGGGPGCSGASCTVAAYPGGAGGQQSLWAQTSNLELAGPAGGSGGGGSPGNLGNAGTSQTPQGYGGGGGGGGCSAGNPNDGGDGSAGIVVIQYQPVLGACSASLGSCSTAGQIEYTGGKMRYCDGANWYAIAE